MARSFRLAQTLLDGRLSALNKPIPTITIPEKTLKGSDISTIFSHARPLGMSPGYSSEGKLIALAIADDSACRIIEFQHPPKRRDGNVEPPTANVRNQEARQLIQDQILCRDAGEVIAFDMGPLTMSLYCDLGLRVVNAIDIQSAFEASRNPLASIKVVIGVALKVKDGNINNIFRNRVFDETERNRYSDIAMRAWVSQFLINYENGAETFEKVPRIDTKKMDPKLLNMASKIQNDALRLDQKKTFQSTSIGRNGPTPAQIKRDATVLHILQGLKPPADFSPWIQNIWFFQDVFIWPPKWTQIQQPSPQASRQGNLAHHPLNGCPLNKSQWEAVNCMQSLTDDHRIVIVQGPPGTGKTSVIASFVQFAIQEGQQGLWLVAQSNVAVKNIAEKLLKIGFYNWKLLVSVDFHQEWHEHIYHQIADHVVRSDFFNIAANKTNLRGIQVILCTLSMLSSNQITKFTKKIPLTTLVVDEASQIEIGNYLSIFTNFKSTLRKVCFIGDDKQLPPYGQEELKDLQSIFEVPHLRKKVIFLNTQYRMPPQIGDLISAAVYDSKLKSNPQHPIKDDIIASYFINIPGKELPQQGGSFKNLEECEVILHLAQKLQDARKDYKIITPYEAQTSLIEKRMEETQGLEWQDKCFNIDSFQGNEEDYIIISIVRSHEMGFLKDIRRTNVMLTRCKKGMFIATSHQFLSGPGEDSLIGQYMNQLEPEAWLSRDDIEAGIFLKD